MLILCAAISLGVQLSNGQVRPHRPTSLQQYLADHPWNAAVRGPMLVVDTRSEQASTAETGLAAFGKQEIKAGSMTAIAPIEMVLIDTEFKDPADMYDGLPREQKVLYLASLLDSNQWGIAASKGIGLGDLNRDQQAVFRSILPSKFTYFNMRMGEHGQTTNVPGEAAQITLTPDQESGVRLQFSKEIALGVRLADDKGFSAIANQVADEVKVGEPVLTREDSTPEDETTLFGAKIRKILPNTLKASDLNYKSTALDAMLPLPPIKTVEDLCKAASGATDLTLIPDARIAKLAVQTAGPSARVGDVLRALSLCLTSTFRKVGDVYVLTSDLEGIGTKRMKLALWRWDLLQQTRIRSEAWKQAIRTNGGIRKVGIPANSPLQPNDAMNKFMADDSDQGNKTMPTSELPRVWQSLLTAGQHLFGSSTLIRLDVVEPWEEVFWNFVLPNGSSLRWEAELGDLNEFTKPSRARRDTSSKSVVKPLLLPPDSAPALVYKTNDSSLATSMPQIAKDHGFREVWIHTSNPQCVVEAIRAAKTAAMPLRLVIQPWETLPPFPSKNPDRTVLGNTLGEAKILQARTAWWQEAEPSWGVSLVPSANTEGPDDPMRAQAWKSLIKMASTPGLSGTVLLETQPTGYEPQVSNVTYAPIEMTSILDLGYTAELRKQFLVQHSVDPVDFVDTRLDTGKLDLSQPPYGDPRNFGFGSLDSSQPPGSILQWFQMIAEKNLKATSEFANKIPGPVIIQARQTTHDMPRLGQYVLVPWETSKPLPTTERGPYEDQHIPSEDYMLWQFGYPIEAKVGSRIFDHLVRQLKTGEKIAIDVSSVPEDLLSKFLDVWFATKTQG